MDLGTPFAIGYSLLHTAAMIGASILLWNAFRFRRDPEVMPYARDGSQKAADTSPLETAGKTPTNRT